MNKRSRQPAITQPLWMPRIGSLSDRTAEDSYGDEQNVSETSSLRAELSRECKTPITTQLA